MSVRKVPFLKFVVLFYYLLMICDLPFSIQLTSIYAAPSVRRTAYSKRHINNKNIKGRKTKAMERRKKQYDKKYKIPGKQGEK